MADLRMAIGTPLLCLRSAGAGNERFDPGSFLRYVAALSNYRKPIALIKHHFNRKEVKRKE